MSRFPTNLHVGQGASPDEFDIEAGIPSRVGKRLRDRDEYVKSVLTGGASAPEGLDVKGITTGGFTRSPQAIFRRGLSAANGSHTSLPDLKWWTPNAWVPVINIQPLTLTKLSVLHIQAQAAVTITARHGGRPLFFGLLINGNIFSQPFLSWILQSPPRPSGFLSECANMSADVVLGPGNHQIGLFILLVDSPRGFAQMFIQTIAAPSLSILII